jgi:hypothetical protein
MVRADGTVVGSVHLGLPEHNYAEAATGELAVTQDGKHAVVSYVEDVFFLRVGEGLIKHLQCGEERGLVQPTFTPDSKLVAFKYMEEEEGSYPRATAIAFFTPEGAEVSRVPIPRIDPATTRPAVTTGRAD